MRLIDSITLRQRVMEFLIDPNGSRRKATRADCEFCKQSFLRRLNGKQRFCSKVCKDKASERSVILICRQCNVEFKRKAHWLQSSRHGVYFCSRQCKDRAQRLDSNCAEIRPSHYGTGNSLWWYQATELKLGATCVGCIEKRQYLLLVHHIDGNRTNNETTNLEIVCGNCHIIRHLEWINDAWRYNTKALTQRDKIKELTGT